MQTSRMNRHTVNIHNATGRFTAMRPEPGASPGTLRADPDAVPTALYVIWYNAHHFEEKRLMGLHELDTLSRPAGSLLWLDVRGLKNHDLLQAIASRFDIHPLALADVVNVPQRPKTELYDKHLLVIAHMALLVPVKSPSARGGADPRVGESELHMEQVSVLLGKNVVLTFQESDDDGDAFEPVRQRIRQTRGKIRGSGGDYLTYALLDAVVDGYYPVLEGLAKTFEDLEELTLEKPAPQTGQRIHSLKRVLLTLRRGIWHLRDAMNALLRGEDMEEGQEALMSRGTLVYLRDVYDHVVQVVDMIETYREFAASLMDVYLSSVNNRMNEVVKVLTIISTIFLPLSFIAGIYGMNFDTDKSPWNMPELHWFYGYPFALGLMVVVALGMLYAFRHFGWIGKPPRLPRDSD